ncbi:MAG: hypothetical protein M4579_003662 [Chaenotheca gracillima]|nr:MAG: hypothetical protein M4579_003662 [Chaenotheca gracillima]
MATSKESTKQLPPIENAKRLAAYRAVKDHFPHDARYVGIGSGSTVVYVVEAIAALGRDVTSKMTFVPTGSQSKQLIIEARFNLGSIDTLLPQGEEVEERPDGSEDITKKGTMHVATGKQDLGQKDARLMLDVSFDGADEVDDDLNCIKGGGACLFLEKLVAINAKKFICVADQRKLRPRLLTTWPTIPIEVAPLSAPSVIKTLHSLGSSDPRLRLGTPGKAGPLVTDNGLYIIDAPFPTLLLPTDKKSEGKWEVHELGQRLKEIVGVFEVGLFSGYNGIEAEKNEDAGGAQKPVAAYFGMEDGSVTVLAAEGKEGVRRYSLQANEL